jgi:hypothetical protein
MMKFMPRDNGSSTKRPKVSTPSDFPDGILRKPKRKQVDALVGRLEHSCIMMSEVFLNFKI